MDIFRANRSVADGIPDFPISDASDLLAAAFQWRHNFSAFGV